MKNKALTVLFGVAFFFFIITFSIGLPIYCRFFYYLQINPLNLPQSTGYDFNTIKSSFDELMNFLTLPGVAFSSGVFPVSQEGISHFVDVKVLFDLNFFVLLFSSLTVITLSILKKFKVFELVRPFNMHVSFISAVSVFAIIFIIVVLALIVGFDNAFTAFHHVFFPGKDNWQFDWNKDQIIRILPAQFFLSCGVLIAVSIFAISLSIIIFQLIKKFKQKKC